MAYAKRRKVTASRRRRSVSRPKPRRPRTVRVAWGLTPEVKFQKVGTVGTNWAGVAYTYKDMATTIPGLIVQGTSEQNRTGHRVVGKRLILNMCFVPGGNFTANCPQGIMVRLFLFLDKQCNGAVATFADFTDGTIASGSNGAILCPKTVINKSRFKFLIDKMVYMSPQVLSRQCFTFVIPLGMVFEYNSSGNGIVDMKVNNLQMGYIADVATPNTNLSLDYTYRFEYTDA